MDKYQGYEIGVNTPLVHDVFDYLRRFGYLKKGEILPAGDDPRNFQEEERGIEIQDIHEASLAFERTRSHIREVLRSILGWTFDKYNLPTQNGVDVGSGATGEMVEELLPKTILKDTWKQIDVNPSAVAENKRRHFDSKIYKGSYLNLEETTGIKADSMDIGTGFREMQAMGHNPPYKVELLQGPVIIPIVYDTPEGSLSVVELFRRNLGRYLSKNSGMETIMNDWVTTRRRSAVGTIYHSNIFLQVPYPHVEEVSAVVTLARKTA